MTGNQLLMQRFERRSIMRFGDMGDPAVRRKAAKHYARLARQAQRQIRIRRFLHEPRFAFVDMIFVAFLAALLSVGVTLLIHH